MVGNRANLEYADVVQQVHSDYLRVGADIITSNNFWTTPTRLDSIGERHAWRTYATAAVRNAVEARNAMRQEAYVAGGIAAPSLQGAMSPTSPVSDARTLGLEAYHREWADHARLLADEGADLILARVRRLHRGLRRGCRWLCQGGRAGLPRRSAHPRRRRNAVWREPD